MNYKEALDSAMTLQNIDLTIPTVPFNIYLKNTGDILTLCFLEEETDDYLIIVETSSDGGEEIRIIPKENIEYISFFYDFESLKVEYTDKMIN